ncbi:MAG: HU family DNA-binding protein [Sutterella sp.]|nr:HU family DNA-binding protein [Sutterella sp.]
MNKSEFVDAIAAKVGMPKTQVAKVVDAMADTIVETVAKGDDVRLIGFGTFAVSNRAARTGRNPQTGATIKIAASKAPKFTAGAQFKAAVKA